MSRTSLADLSTRFEHSECGRVSIDFNQEDEIKMTLVVTPEYIGDEDVIANRLWKAYVREKIKEWRTDFNHPAIIRVSGKKILTPAGSRTRERTTREFKTVQKDHPHDVEVRVEGLKTMAKIDERERRSPIIRRIEIMIKQTRPGQFSFGRIPNPYGKKLSKGFGHKARRFSGVETVSTRDKITVPMLFEDQVVIMYERAKDLGTSQSLAGHFRDITEFEGEVKRICLIDEFLRNPAKAVDIKSDPEYGRLSRNEIADINTRFLKQRLTKFLEFANNWLDMNGYTGCYVESVYHSKSQPEMDALHRILKVGGSAIDNAVSRACYRDDFKVDNTLNQIRLDMAS